MAAQKETVVVVRATRQDPLKPSTGSPAEHSLPGCYVLPRSSREGDGGFVQISGYTIIAPVGSDVEPDDEIRVRGELHQVIGDPGRFPVKRGAGVFITTQRVST